MKDLTITQIEINKHFDYPNRVLIAAKHDIIKSIDLLLKINNSIVTGELLDAYKLAKLRLKQIEEALLLLNAV